MKTAVPRIREARESDDSRIGDLLVESFLTAYARKMPEVVVTEQRKSDLRDVARKRATACVLVAEDSAEAGEAEVIGSATLFRPGSPGSRAWITGYAEIRFVAVDLRFSGRGVGDALLEEAARRARAFGAKGICLHVRRGATGLARFYGRNGYERMPEGDVDLLPEIFLEAYAMSFNEGEKKETQHDVKDAQDQQDRRSVVSFVDCGSTSGCSGSPASDRTA